MKKAFTKDLEEKKMDGEYSVSSPPKRAQGPVFYNMSLPYG
jgi:hypothetical protein